MDGCESKYISVIYLTEKGFSSGIMVQGHVVTKPKINYFPLSSPQSLTGRESDSCSSVKCRRPEAHFEFVQRKELD